MPYIGIRGNLGLANTRVYGLPAQELEVVESILRMGAKNDEKGEVTFYNAAMYLINQLEYHLGYVVITLASTEDQLMWTMYKPPGDPLPKETVRICLLFISYNK